MNAATIALISGPFALLLMAAAVVFPASRRHADRARWRRLLTRSPKWGRGTTAKAGRHHRVRPPLPEQDSGPGATVLAPGPAQAALRPAVTWLASVWRDPRRSAWGAAAGATVAGIVGWALAGAVGAAVVVAYTTAGLVAVRGVAVRRSREQGLRLAADAVQCLAADLRAGVAMESALRAADTALRRAVATQLPGWRRKNAANEEKDGVLAVARRVDAAVTLAQASGAALADLLDRLDAHIRAGQRARAIAHAQAAGARASATILAAMPFAGIALGSAIGADPWHVLLHTVAGGIALCAAVALQLAGLGWTARLARIEVLP